MSKEKLYALRGQLSKFLYDPTPRQTAWRDKMWDEGRFDETIKETEKVEKYLEDVERRIEAVEAAEPSIGESLATNFLLNLPLGKQLKGTGLGSLLGLAEEKMGAAEAQRLKDIERELNQLNSIYQQEGRGMEEMEALKQEKEGLMSLLGDTPTTEDEDLIAKIMVGVEKDLEELAAEEAEKEAERIEVAPGIKFTVEEWNDFIDEDVAEERGMSVEEYRQSVAEKIGKKLNGKYQGGGLIMNYEDYGRDYV